MTLEPKELGYLTSFIKLFFFVTNIKQNDKMAGVQSTLVLNFDK